MGAGPSKSTEGSQVTVNFTFQFVPPLAVVVANLHRLLRVSEGILGHGYITQTQGTLSGEPASLCWPFCGIWVRPPDTGNHQQPGATTAKQTVTFTASKRAREQRCWLACAPSPALDLGLATPLWVLARLSWSILHPGVAHGRKWQKNHTLGSSTGTGEGMRGLPAVSLLSSLVLSPGLVFSAVWLLLW